jgi:threonine dehydrogenase-like Zn-dependent dehydrogenase
MPTMQGVILPGNSTVEFRDFDIPQPGHGQVVLKTKASSICGSDIRAIYRAHLGKGAEGYRPGTIAGHEPCGQVTAVGPGVKRLKPGDRVVVYHISGCGVCEDCRRGYMISCHSEQRAAYGWQRNGGHAPYILVEESNCIPLPDNLSYIDGALCACGTGTGLGPVGLAAAQLGRALGARPVIGIDVSPARRKLAEDLGLCDYTFAADDRALSHIMDATKGHGCEVAIDCSGAPSARLLALQGTRQWGRCVFVGEGNTVQFDVSPLLIHQQITLFGSWVTSLDHLEQLVEHLSRWNIHPDITCTDRLPIRDAAKAYDIADKGQTGKVCIVFED